MSRSTGNSQSPRSLTHSEAEELLSARLDAPIDPWDNRALLGHLQGCASCRAFAVQMEVMARDLESLPRLPASPAVRREVHNRITAPPSFWGRLTASGSSGNGGFGRALPVALAAMVLLVAVTTYVLVELTGSGGGGVGSINAPGEVAVQLTPAENAQSSADATGTVSVLSELPSLSPTATVRVVPPPPTFGASSTAAAGGLATVTPSPESGAPALAQSLPTATAGTENATTAGEPEITVESARTPADQGGQVAAAGFGQPSPTATAEASGGEPPEPTATEETTGIAAAGDPESSAKAGATPAIDGDGTAITAAEPTATSEASPTPSATLEPTATASPEPSPTETPAPPTATATPEPTETATLEPTETAEPTQTATPEPTWTPTEEPTATATLEPTATPSPTSEPTHTPTSEPTITPSPTATPTETPYAEVQQGQPPIVPVAGNAIETGEEESGSTQIQSQGPTEPEPTETAASQSGSSQIVSVGGGADEGEESEEATEEPTSETEEGLGGQTAMMLDSAPVVTDLGPGVSAPIGRIEFRSSVDFFCAWLSDGSLGVIGTNGSVVASLGAANYPVWSPLGGVLLYADVSSGASRVMTWDAETGDIYGGGEPSDQTVNDVPAGWSGSEYYYQRTFPDSPGEIEFHAASWDGSGDRLIWSSTDVYPVSARPVATDFGFMFATGSSWIGVAPDGGSWVVGSNPYGAIGAAILGPGRSLIAYTVGNEIVVAETSNPGAALGSSIPFTGGFDFSSAGDQIVVANGSSLMIYSLYGDYVGSAGGSNLIGPPYWLDDTIYYLEQGPTTTLRTVSASEVVSQ
jgi:type VI secretion system secreted protein VgrG